MGNDANGVQVKIEANSAQAVQQTENAAKALANLKQKIAENSETLKANREANKSVIDATKRGADAAGQLALKKSALARALNGLNGILPGLGNSLRALLNPYTAVAAAAAWLIKLNVDLRNDYKNYLAEIDKATQEHLAKIQQSMAAQKQAAIEFKVELDAAAKSARGLYEDMQDILHYRTAEEQAIAKETDAEEARAKAKAVNEFKGNEAGLLVANANIEAQFARKRAENEKKFAASRIEARAFGQHFIANQLPAARERAESLQAGLGAPVTYDGLMAEYDADTAAMEGELAEQKNTKFRYNPVGYRAAAERLTVRKAGRGAFSISAAKRAEEYARKKKEFDAADAEYKRLKNQSEDLADESNREITTSHLVSPINLRAQEAARQAANQATINELTSMLQRAWEERDKLLRQMADAVMKGVAINPEMQAKVAELDTSVKQAQDAIKNIRPHLPGQ